MSANLSAILFLITGVLFILALRGLSSPETSRTGNLLGILGMILAVIVSILSVDIIFLNLIGGKKVDKRINSPHFDTF